MWQGPESVKRAFPRLQGQVTACTLHSQPNGSSSTVSNANPQVGIMRVLAERRKPGPEQSYPLNNLASAFWFLLAPVLVVCLVFPRKVNHPCGHKVYRGSMGAALPRRDSRQHNRELSVAELHVPPPAGEDQRGFAGTGSK